MTSRWRSYVFVKQQTKKTYLWKKLSSHALRVALSPILVYLDDPAIIEIMVNADGRVWVDLDKINSYHEKLSLDYIDYESIP